MRTFAFLATMFIGDAAALWLLVRASHNRRPGPLGIVLTSAVPLVLWAPVWLSINAYFRYAHLPIHWGTEPFLFVVGAALCYPIIVAINFALLFSLFPRRNE